MPAPAVVGAVAVEVSADEDCRWYAGGSYTGTRSVTVPLPFTNPWEDQKVTAAGVDIQIPRSEACSYSSPGGVLEAGPDGGSFRVPVETAPGCPWLVGVGPGITAEPMSGSGPGEVTIAVAPNRAYTDEIKLLSVAGIQRRVVVKSRTCSYDVVAPSALAAGSGVGLVPVKAPEQCRWSLYSSAPWIHTSRIAFDPVFRFDPNPLGLPRSAEISFRAGETFLVTQDAAATGAPLLVEPNNASGPSAVFRFTWATGSVDSGAKRIRIGEECVLNYDHAENRFAAAGDGCRWDSPHAETADGFLTITASATFYSRGQLLLVSGERQLGIFTATDSHPEPPAPIAPLEGAGWLPPQQLQINGTAGSAGIFRFVLSAQYTVVQTSLGPLCSFRVHVADGTLALADDERLWRIGAAGRVEAGHCVADLENSSITRKPDRYVLDLAVRFRSTLPGTYFTSAGLQQFTVVPAVAPPSAVILPDLLRVGFPATTPIERARVVAGDCSIQYERASGVMEAKGCELGEGSAARLIGGDLILLLRLRTPVSGSLSAEQTPLGGIGSGLFPLGAIMPP